MDGWLGGLGSMLFNQVGGLSGMPIAIENHDVNLYVRPTVPVAPSRTLTVAPSPCFGTKGHWLYMYVPDSSGN